MRANGVENSDVPPAKVLNESEIEITRMTGEERHITRHRSPKLRFRSIYASFTSPMP